MLSDRWGARLSIKTWEWAKGFTDSSENITCRRLWPAGTRTINHKASNDLKVRTHGCKLLSASVNARRLWRDEGRQRRVATFGYPRSVQCRSAMCSKTPLRSQIQRDEKGFYDLCILMLSLLGRSSARVLGRFTDLKVPDLTFHNVLVPSARAPCQTSYSNILFL
jgi:hypothetical protein